MSYVNAVSTPLAELWVRRSLPFLQLDHCLDGRGSLADDVVAPLSSNPDDDLCLKVSKMEGKCDQLDQNKSELVDLLGAINE